ncbi:hypothetical protein GCM10023223_44890 [Stackebrandtia albiflava]
MTFVALCDTARPAHTTGDEAFTETLAGRNGRNGVTDTTHRIGQPPPRLRNWGTRVMAWKGSGVGVRLGPAG